MTHLFDGLATLCDSVFGGTVTHLPRAGGPAVIEAIFRETPVELPAEIDVGENRWLAPTLAVREPVALTIFAGDMIDPGKGRIYRVQPDGQPSGSPAADRFWTFSLEEI